MAAKSCAAAGKPSPLGCASDADERITMHQQIGKSALLLALLLLIGNTSEKKPVVEGPRIDMVKAARKTHETLLQRYQANEPLTPSFLDLLCTWSARLAQAERDVAVTREARAAAIERHRKELADIGDRMKGIHDGPPQTIWIGTLEYYDAQARTWLIEEDAPSGGK
jgi:hypothetical protein